MVESIEDAIDTCKRCDINFIYIPEDQDVDVQQYHLSDKEIKELKSEGNKLSDQQKTGSDKGAFINS